MNELLPAEPESAAPPFPADPAKLARLRRQARRIRRRVNFAYYIYLFGNFGVVMALLPRSLSAGARGALSALLTIVWLALIGTYKQGLNKRWRQTVDAMTALVGAEAAGVLIESLSSAELKKEAREILTELLPRLNSSDAHLLTPHHHCLLNRVLDGREILRFETRKPVILAALKAYEQIGGTEDLATVERLAQGRGHAKRNRDIRTAAQACLPYLRERSEQQETRQTLLRASGASADNGDTLLRPAAAAGNAAPQELLRPAAPGT